MVFLAVDELKVAANKICFQSSNGWDAHGAGAFGFLAVWVNRFNQPPEKLPFEPHVEIKTLSDLPNLLSI